MVETEWGNTQGVLTTDTMAKHGRWHNEAKHEAQHGDTLDMHQSTLLLKAVNPLAGSVGSAGLGRLRNS